jgi:hypothetical protein
VRSIRENPVAPIRGRIAVAVRWRRLCLASVAPEDGSPNTSSAPAASAAPGAGAVFGGRARLSRQPVHHRAGGGGRVHPYRHAAARRRGRRVRPAPRRETANAAVRQRRRRAGGRLPLFARLPDDGRGRQHARACRCSPTPPTSSPRARCCSCSTATTPTSSSTLPAGDPLQDGQAVRGRRPPGRDSRRRGPETLEMAWRDYGMHLGHGLPADRRRARLLGATRPTPASILATIWPKASRRCR